MPRPRTRAKAPVPAFAGSGAAPAARLTGLPNGLTLAGLGLGFLAALAAGRGEVDQALRVLALAALADAFAGLAAQGLSQATPIGAELDSLASLVVWGLAVALLAYARCLRSLGAGGLVLAGLIVAASAWRLCRGDAQRGRRLYDGLPLPAAGGMLAAAEAWGAPALWLGVLIALVAAAQLGPWTYPRVKAGQIWFVPLLLSLGLAAFGWRAGWALPGLAAAAYAVGAPFAGRRA